MTIEKGTRVEANRDIPFKGVSKGDRGTVTDIRNDGGDYYLSLSMDKGYFLGPSCDNCWNEVTGEESASVSEPAPQVQELENPDKLHIHFHYTNDTEKNNMGDCISSALAAFVSKTLTPGLGYVVTLDPYKIGIPGASNKFILSMEDGALHIQAASKEMPYDNGNILRRNDWTGLPDPYPEVPWVYPLKQTQLKD